MAAKNKRATNLDLFLPFKICKKDYPTYNNHSGGLLGVLGDHGFNHSLLASKSKAFNKIVTKLCIFECDQPEAFDSAFSHRNCAYESYSDPTDDSYPNAKNKDVITEFIWNHDVKIRWLPWYLPENRGVTVIKNKNYVYNQAFDNAIYDGVTCSTAVSDLIFANCVLTTLYKPSIIPRVSAQPVSTNPSTISLDLPKAITRSYTDRADGKWEVIGGTMTSFDF